MALSDYLRSSRVRMDSDRLKSLSAKVNNTFPAASPLPEDPTKALVEARDKERVKPKRPGREKRSRRNQRRNPLGEQLAAAIGALEGTRAKNNSANSPLTGVLGSNPKLG